MHDYEDSLILMYSFLSVEKHIKKNSLFFINIPSQKLIDLDGNNNFNVFVVIIYYVKVKETKSNY